MTTAAHNQNRRAPNTRLYIKQPHTSQDPTTSRAPQVWRRIRRICLILDWSVGGRPRCRALDTDKLIDELLERGGSCAGVGIGVRVECAGSQMRAAEHHCCTRPGHTCVLLPEQMRHAQKPRSDTLGIRVHLHMIRAQAWHSNGMHPRQSQPVQINCTLVPSNTRKGTE